MKQSAPESLVLDSTPLRERYLDLVRDEIKAGNYDRLESWSLIKMAQDNPFGYQTIKPAQEPPFAVSDRVAGVVDELNQALLDYANALVALADGKLLADADVDRVATKLNTQVRSFVTKMSELSKEAGYQTIEVPDGSLELVSTAVAALWKEYLKRKQSRALRDAIAANEDTVTAIAASMQSLARASALFHWQDYQSGQQGPNRDILDTPATSPADVRATVDEQLKARDAQVQRLAALHALNRAYGKFPAAHADLEKAAGGTIDGLEDLKTFAMEAYETFKLYRSLVKDAEKKS